MCKRRHLPCCGSLCGIGDLVAGGGWKKKERGSAAAKSANSLRETGRRGGGRFPRTKQRGHFRLGKSAPFYYACQTIASKERRLVSGQGYGPARARTRWSGYSVRKFSFLEFAVSFLPFLLVPRVGD